MNVDQLASGVEALERSARRWRRACVGLAVCGVVGLACGAVAKPGPLVATSLTIVDAKGNESAVLREDLGYGSFLTFKYLDRDVAGLGSVNASGQMFVIARKGQARIDAETSHLDDDPSPEASLRVRGPDGSIRGMLGPQLKD